MVLHQQSGPPKKEKSESNNKKRMDWKSSNKMKIVLNVWLQRQSMPSRVKLREKSIPGGKWCSCWEAWRHKISSPPSYHPTAKLPIATLSVQNVQRNQNYTELEWQWLVINSILIKISDPQLSEALMQRSISTVFFQMHT